MWQREAEVALAAARQAAAAIAEIYARPQVESVEKADDKGPLTEADLKANQILIDTISAAFPDDAILSEETVDDPKRVENRRAWIIDPLDGTREFTMKIPEFVVSVGLALDGDVIVGVLVNPVTGEEFVGVVGGQFTYNGTPTRVTDHAVVDGARFLVSRSEMKKGWFAAWEGKCDLKPMGSVAYKLGLVAAGLSEASFTPVPRNEWDLAGGVACLRAAGGRATDRDGVDYKFNRPDPLHAGVCCTNGAIHGVVLELMQSQRG